MLMIKDKPKRVREAICLTLNPLTTCESLQESGRLGSLERTLELGLRHYECVYLITMDKQQFNFYKTNFIHLTVKPLPLPRYLNIMYYYIRAGLKIFKLALKCELIRAIGGCYELHATIGSILSRRPLVISFRYDLVKELATSRSTFRQIASRLVYLVVRFSIHHASVVIVPTKTLMLKATKMGCLPSKILVVPTPIDTSRFNVSADGSRIRKKYDLKEKTIIFIGRLRPLKQVHNLIKAIAIIKMDCPVRLLILGKGSFEKELRRLCAELNISDRVTFVGLVQHERIPEYLAAADVFVLPSLLEGIPKVLLEAMCMKKPIVATKALGITDLVKNGETALLVRPGDVKALADAIAKILRDEHLADFLSSHAKKAFEKEYAFESVYEKHREVIDKYLILID